ncbi:LPXTG cell wall anchor domain-containing protein [Streptomyces sp. NPDC101150]|uniref:LPXTG cell wall anchor domain-containing protein n=1 Tax=Streptomyces sp. NPDC101150 TaxID=3366114 RepID=UPI0037FB5DA4
MTQALLRRPRIWVRATLALSCASVLTFTGLPGLYGPGAAYAAKGKRCDDKFGLRGQTPSTSQPWNQNIHVRAPRDWDAYDYDTPRQALDGLTLPPGTPEEQRAFLRDLAPYKTYRENTPSRVFAQYRDYMDRYKWNDTQFGSFGEWLRRAWIQPNNNNRKGEFFERKVVKDLKLVGPDWLCQEEIEIKDKDGKTIMIKDKNGKMKPLVRKFDAVNYRAGEYLEFKAGPTRDTKQDLANEKFLEDPTRKGARVTYVNGESKTDATSKYLGRLADKYGRVTAYEHISNAEQKYPRGKFSQPDPNLSPGGNNRAGGGASRVTGDSPATPNDMPKRLKEWQRSDYGGGNRGRGPGGVDFSTLELSYVGKPVKGKGLPYAYSAKKVDESKGLGWGGKAKAQLISDAFLTWLALTPDKFWVNLNPDQPDRVMDNKFASTDAGRVLLEADLQMKHDFFKAMDPKTDLGRRFWAQLPRENGYPCFGGIRNWIEPKPAKVREQDGGVYILDAPLKLSSTPQDFTTQPGSGTENACHPSTAERQQAQRVIDRMIVPAVEKTINTAPQYADLRRVYTARVAAEWIRIQDAKKPTDYRKIINSNDVSKWPLRAPNKKWDKDVLFRKYRKIFTDGEFRYNVDTAKGVAVYIVGGVDFSKAPKRNTTKIEFTTRHRQLPRQAGFARQTVTDDAERRGLVLLGGGDESNAGGGGSSDPLPTPTPKPSGKPDPTGKPSTPAPDPTATISNGGSGGSDHDNNQPGPDGDLAHTGSDTPVGLMAAIAAALAAAGGGLVWWMRRRKTAA